MSTPEPPAPGDPVAAAEHEPTGADRGVPVRGGRTSPGAEPPSSGGETATPEAGLAPTGKEPPAPEEELTRVREEIERIDRAMIGLIAERVRLGKRVGAAKRAAGLPILDPAREAAVVRRAGSLAREAGLEDEDVRYIFWHLIGLSRRAQLEES